MFLYVFRGHFAGITGDINAF